MKTSYHLYDTAILAMVKMNGFKIELLTAIQFFVFISIPNFRIQITVDLDPYFRFEKNCADLPAVKKRVFDLSAIVRVSQSGTKIFSASYTG